MIQQSAISFQGRQTQLKDQINMLEQRAQEINQDIKKKRKTPGSQDRQIKLKTLQNQIDKMKQLSEDLQHLVIDEQKWLKLIALLEIMYSNLDNPDHEQEFNQLIPQLYQTKIVQTAWNDRILQSNRSIIEPFDQKAATQQAQLVDQNSAAYKIKMMDFSYNDRPQKNDYYQPPTFKEKLNLNRLLPKYKMLPHSVFSQLSCDTLFYVFYYPKEPTEQLMAARELIKNQWIYNTKHGLWMKKDKHYQYENEKVIKGPFIYFDCEAKWQQKKKPDFQFKKKHILQYELIQ
ncbi:unnamed protein product (macronuclear) [Paramecium tetraurelia]|uniref:NOT2/NOT3/NOT5 C-terminal domain-containing protein n=1 Tax=Paramecium tetraurelia TaxID=5888 RepID=A0E3P2_PARTE|nr:uncharacterized protein GSPATT00023082001 [Paramecium tetraurelia]CAK89909.1 unnamed protein product [Paramecium tetraurelia]|eukprot:XP_001457306.1 hypothetical protein (macronuclear) [Paramecium tetraurelia strain d4-2]